MVDDKPSTIGISLSVTCVQDGEQLIKIVEILSRTAVGLSLEGFSVGLNLITITSDDISEGEISG